MVTPCTHTQVLFWRRLARQREGQSQSLCDITYIAYRRPVLAACYSAVSLRAGGAGGNRNGLYFAGHIILAAVVDELVASYRLDRANAVLLTGCSAGGLGTFFNVDWLAERLPGVNVRGNPQAGWFGSPIPSWEARTNHDNDDDPSHFQMVSWILNINYLRFSALLKCEQDVSTRASASERPMAATVGSYTVTGSAERSRAETQPVRREHVVAGDISQPVKACVFPPIFYKYITTPLFISENTADA